MDLFNPKKLFESLKLKNDWLAVDLGCGSGRISIPLAKRIENGLVYAVDIRKEPLIVLRSKFLKEKITNINIIRCDLEKGSGISGSFFDLALAVDILFQNKNPDAIISEASRILKKSGIFFVSERISNDGLENIGFSPLELINIAKKVKLRLKKEIDFGEKRFGLIFEKI